MSTPYEFIDMQLLRPKHSSLSFWSSFEANEYRYIPYIHVLYDVIELLREKSKSLGIAPVSEDSYEPGHLPSLIIHLSSVMRKPTFCICENKDADQLRGNREADQRLCFRYIDSTIPQLSKSEISSL